MVTQITRGCGVKHSLPKMIMVYMHQEHTERGCRFSFLVESTTIDTCFAAWYDHYDEIVKLANEVGATESVPRITTLQRNRSNTPSSSPMEHYKRTVAIPFLDYLCGQMEERFKADMKQITPIVFSTLCHLYWSPHPCTLITS